MKKYIVNIHFRLYVNREDIFFSSSSLLLFPLYLSSFTTFIHLDIHKLWHWEHLSFFIPYFFLFVIVDHSPRFFVTLFTYIAKEYGIRLDFFADFFTCATFLYFFKNIQLVVIFFRMVFNHNSTYALWFLFSEREPEI